MKIQPGYLLQRPGGKYYFRMSIPEKLRPVLRKRELKQHIICQDLDYARETAIQLGASWKHVFNKMRDCMAQQKKPPTLQLIIGELIADHKTGTVQAKSIEFDPDNLDAERDAVQKLLFGMPNQQPNNTQNETETTPTNLLSEVVQAYCNERDAGNNWRPKSAAEFRVMFDELIEILGDVPIASITKQAARQYKEILRQLPPHFRKKPEYSGHTIKEIAALKPTETLSAKTINKRLQSVSAMFKWAKNNGYCADNPFEGLSVKLKAKAADRRDPFTDEELERIFGNHGFVKPNSSRPNRYWIPIVALYTGARLEEVAQLHIEDIRDVDRHWCIDINDKLEKRVKSPGSKRLVPLSEELINLGFLDFVESQRAQGEERLFPELDGERDGYGQSFQKWFGREKDKVGFPKRIKSFHSLRHTFIDRLRNLGIDEAKLAALVGHTNSSITSTYGQGYHIAQLHEVVNKLRFSRLISGDRSI